MNTLPTRKDGGIDWGKIRSNDMGFQWRVGDATHWASHDAFPAMCYEHAIEWCSRVVDAQGGTYNKDDPYERGMADGIDQCFNAISKLEV